MHKTRGWTGLRTAILTLAVGLGASAQASASATLISYNTIGNVSSKGVSGPNVIGFNSVASGSFVTPSAFGLGEFLVGALPVGVTTTYEDTPFEIVLGVQKINDQETSVTPIKITGKLNGEISGPSQSSVVATFDPIDMEKLPLGDMGAELSVLDPSVWLVPSTTNGGRTTAQGRFFTSKAPVPEPGAVAVLLLGLAGYGVHRRRRARS